MYCKECGRNITIGFKKSVFERMNAMERKTSLAATKRWYNDFSKLHKELRTKELRAK